MDPSVWGMTYHRMTLLQDLMDSDQGFESLDLIGQDRLHTEPAPKRN